MKCDGAQQSAGSSRRVAAGSTCRLERRVLLRTLSTIALMGPFAGFAQQRRSPRRIGVLFMLLSPEGKEARAFKQALQESGYVEGRDVVIEWHFAKADYARLPELAAELVQHNVDVIIADTGPAAQAVRQATSSIPIVMTIVADPFGSGLIASLARPGGNVTGLSIMLAELSAKRLQLLKDALPRIRRVAVLWHPATPYHTKALDDLKATAPSMAIELSFIDIRAPEQIDAGFRAAGRTRAQAIFVLDCPLFFTHRTTLVGLASKSSLPLISGEQPYADAGGLLTYGPDYADQMRRSAGYVDKIFKGAKPGDLPVEQPIKFDLVINLKTAKALDIKISNSILLRANRVIE